ncbi:MAG: DNA repair protein RadC [bacterium]|nr:DNA repair protein RadC [bacterium]
MSSRIQDMDPAQRPRERLMDRGPSVLSDAELLAVLLRTGSMGSGVVEQAHRLLSAVGGVAGLARLSPQELVMHPGIGSAKSSSICAALELGRRLLRAELHHGGCLDRPEVAGDYLVAQFSGCRIEVFGAICLDAQHRVQAVEELSSGTRTQAPVDIGELFRRSLVRSTSELLVFHNHPSGVITPSKDDLELTARLVKGGAIVGVSVVDHILVAGNRWVSLRVTNPDLFE